MGGGSLSKKVIAYAQIPTKHLSFRQHLGLPNYSSPFTEIYTTTEESLAQRKEKVTIFCNNLDFFTMLVWISARTLRSRW